jgi:hypothetical protein
LKAAYLIKRKWRSHWGLLAGVATGAVVVAAQSLGPHAGEGCGRLGQIEQEWRIGLPSRHVMCVANLDGRLVYDRLVLPPKPSRPAASLLQ